MFVEYRGVAGVKWPMACCKLTDFRETREFGRADGIVLSPGMFEIY